MVFPFHADLLHGNFSPKARAVMSPGCHLCPGLVLDLNTSVFRSRTCEVQSQHVFPKELFVSPFSLESEMPFV